MTDAQLKVIIGSLLHDIGKLVISADSTSEFNINGRHSESGYAYLKKLVPQCDDELLDCVRYHHGSSLETSGLPADSLAYIVNFAVNTAAAADRREQTESEMEFDKTQPLLSVFNLLNNNTAHKHYERRLFDPEFINYPTDEPVDPDDGFYDKVIDNMTDILKAMKLDRDYIAGLLTVLENTLMFVPASTAHREQQDVSMFDNGKVSAAVAECTYIYLKEHGISDYKSFLFDGRNKDAMFDDGHNPWREPMFLIYNLDMSGIQNFIHSISEADKELLQGLIYIEFGVEHMIETLLERLEISKACTLNIGGGNGYILLPNTDRVKETIAEYVKDVNSWYTDHCGVELYAAQGYVTATAAALKNEPKGSYRGLFAKISEVMYAVKGSKYGAKELRQLNNMRDRNECTVCHKITRINADGRCDVCEAMHNAGDRLKYGEYFVVMNRQLENGMPMPVNCCLLGCDLEELKQYMKDPGFIRSYNRGKRNDLEHAKRRFWISRYGFDKKFFREADEGAGGSTKRIAMLKADVDNMGNAFMKGFNRDDDDTGRYTTLSRTVSLSRQLSLFFRCHMDALFENGETRYLSSGGARDISVVYCGGDDICIAGKWNDLIDAAADLRLKFEKYTVSTLTVSCGIGLFNDNYPLSLMNDEAAGLESCAKSRKPQEASAKEAVGSRPDQGKDAITLFDDSGMYSWNTYINEVMEGKFRLLSGFMSGITAEKNDKLYELLDILRADDAPFDETACRQWLSDQAPAVNAQMLKWAADSEDRRQLITALRLYIYLNVEK